MHRTKISHLKNFFKYFVMPSHKLHMHVLRRIFIGGSLLNIFPYMYLLIICENCVALKFKMMKFCLLVPLQLLNSVFF